MTQYDIRLRRKSLTRGQIERHKNFKGLRGMGEDKKPTSNVLRVLVILASLVIIGGMVYFGYARITKEKAPASNEKYEDVFDEFKQ